MILRDGDGVEWECTELHFWGSVGEPEATDYRVLRCTRANHPDALRYISVPRKLDLAGPSIQCQVLRSPDKRE